MIDPLVFSNLKSYLLNQDLTLKFAMNAGMFRKDLSPAGHYVEAGNQYRQVIRKAAPGNFGMLPTWLNRWNDDTFWKNKVCPRPSLIEQRNQASKATKKVRLLRGACYVSWQL